MRRNQVVTLIPHFTNSRQPSTMDCSHWHAGTYFCSHNAASPWANPRKGLTDDPLHNSNWVYPLGSLFYWCYEFNVKYGVIMSPRGLRLITVTGICTRFGFRICIVFRNIIFGLDLNLKNLNHFGVWKRLKGTVWGPLPWSRYANTTLNHDNVLIYCSLLAPQWKAKSQVYLCTSWGRLIFKREHSATRQSRQIICANLDHHWSKNPHFVCVNENELGSGLQTGTGKPGHFPQKFLQTWQRSRTPREVISRGCVTFPWASSQDKLFRIRLCCVI